MSDESTTLPHLANVLVIGYVHELDATGFAALCKRYKLDPISINFGGVPWRTVIDGRPIICLLSPWGGFTLFGIKVAADIPRICEVFMNLLAVGNMAPYEYSSRIISLLYKGQFKRHVNLKAMFTFLKQRSIEIQQRREKKASILTLILRLDETTKCEYHIKANGNYQIRLQDAEHIDAAFFMAQVLTEPFFKNVWTPSNYFDS